MSGKAKKSSSSKATKQRHSISINDNGGVGAGAGVGDIVDERFVAAITRPQFHKEKKRNSSDGTTSTSTASNNQRITQLQHQADDELDRNGGLGESITRAIRSDDRFRAALFDTDKFGCVPARDKYGRKTKTTKKTKKKKNKDEDSDRGEDAKMATNKRIENYDDNLGVDNSNNNMESRIAYLNALSRGDISGSSSSDDSSVEEERSDDENENDHDDDDNISTYSIHDVKGSSGIFDPSHKSTLPGDEIGEDYAPEDETDEPSPYLCILNLNWEHIRATDVFAMLHSFCPPGTLKKVEVYPSDFGIQRMEKEKVEGPPSGIWKNHKMGKKHRLLECLDGGGEKEGARGNDSEDISSGVFSDEDNNEINFSDDDEEDDNDEDVLDLTDATSKLYAHFPPQSSVMKNSKLQHDDDEEEGFDIEKLREYEASKLRYYFAIATFSTFDAASQVYDNVDGMEMEDSAAEIDVRVLPQDQYLSTIQNRAVRDSCDRLPTKYIPPENAVATALKQSRVTCSWEQGDADREQMLTRYGMGKDAWEALATGEDIKLYLGTSDNSSCTSGGDDDNSDDDVEGELKSGANELARNKKGSSTRKLLGLATSDSEEEIDGTQKVLVGVGSSDDDDSDRSERSNETESGLKPNATTAKMNERIDSKEVTYVPGNQSLDEKIRVMIKHVNTNNAGAVEVDDRNEELSPFQKYLQKRKEKKKERRLASKARKNNGEQYLDHGDKVCNDDTLSIDPELGVAQFSDEELSASGQAVDVSRHDNERFYPNRSYRRSKQTGSEGGELEKTTIMPEGGGSGKAASSREELELLLAGDEDHNKDYDMRGLTKLERHTNKKLKGWRKRQLEILAANVSGQEFCIDASDYRFAELLDGTNDLYGIDRTHPAFRETSAMKKLLQERSKRKKKNRDGCKMGYGGRGGIEEERGEERLSEKTEKHRKGDDCHGAMELSSLVERIQQKVSK